MKTDIRKRFEVELQHGDEEGGVTVRLEGDALIDRCEDDAYVTWQDRKPEAIAIVDLFAAAALVQRAMKEAGDFREFCLVHYGLFEMKAPHYRCPACAAEEKKPELVAAVMQRVVAQHLDLAPAEHDGDAA